MIYAESTTMTKPLFRKNCSKCSGTGRWGWSNQPCFGCNGRGIVETKTDTVALAARRAQKQQEDGDTAQDEFAELHPIESDWIHREAPTFSFAASLLHAIRKHGMLTPAQLAAAQRCAAKANAPKPPPVEVSPAGLGRIEEAFAKAKSRGVARPKMRLGAVVASAAPERGKNPGAVYMTTTDGNYLGKVHKGGLSLLPIAKDWETMILEAIADPQAAAIAYGQRTGNCSICGRMLTVGESIDRGIGPICFERFFGG